MNGIPRATIILNRLEKTLLGLCDEHVDVDDHETLTDRIIEIVATVIDDNSPEPFVDADADGSLIVTFPAAPAWVTLSFDPENRLRCWIDVDDSDEHPEASFDTHSPSLTDHNIFDQIREVIDMAAPATTNDYDE